ncbi:MAG: hypothetical protein WKF75_10380 [Singulisphaera sp.]
MARLGDLSPHAAHLLREPVDAGVGLEQVAALAGHESLEATRRYCTPSRLDLERAVERSANASRPAARGQGCPSTS